VTSDVVLTLHVTRHNTPIHNILSTAPQLSKSKIPSKKSYPYIYIYIYDVKFLALLGAAYLYDISRLRVKL
jgi:hypothetical protein